MQILCARWARTGKRTEVRGLGAPVPLRLGSSKKEMAVTKVVREGYIYDQTYRGSASRGLQSPFLPVPLSGAHRFFPIIAQDFSPGSTCAPAVSRQSRQSLYRGAAVEVEDLAGDEVGLGA